MNVVDGTLTSARICGGMRLHAQRTDCLIVPQTSGPRQPTIYIDASAGMGWDSTERWTGAVDSACDLQADPLIYMHCTPRPPTHQ